MISASTRSSGRLSFRSEHLIPSSHGVTTETSCDTGPVGSDARFLARWELGGVGGVVVAVDVLRAFTTAAYAFAGGATAIWLVAEVDEAVVLGRSIPGALVLGELHGRRPEGFDLPNSPVAVSQADVAGRVLVQRTSAGTQGVVAATSAERVFAASLVCASATARAVTAAVVALDADAPAYVITGRFPDRPDGGLDDLVTARFIEAVRAGESPDPAGAAHDVATSEEAARTLAVGDGHVHPDDIALAVDVDRFSFAMEAERIDGRWRLTASEVPHGS